MSETISAIASLLWPLIVLAVLVLFREPLYRLLRSTESRDFTIKIAGQEVSVGELHRQQVDMISDLQDQIAKLQKTGVDQPARTTSTAPAKQDNPASQIAVAAHSAVPVQNNGGSVTSDFDETDTELTPQVPTQDRPQLHADPVKAPWERLDFLHHETEPQEPKQESGPAPLSVVPQSDDLVPTWSAEAPDTRPKAAGLLWVDDHPEHNALQVDHLERRGVVVDVVRSTKEALQKLTGQRYQLIVSNMERLENGKPVPNAGLELIRTVRTFDRDTPVVIYAAGHGNKVLGDTAAQIGADLVTNSWYQLNQEMRRVGVLN